MVEKRDMLRDEIRRRRRPDRERARHMEGRPAMLMLTGCALMSTDEDSRYSGRYSSDSGGGRPAAGSAAARGQVVRGARGSARGAGARAGAAGAAAGSSGRQAEEGGRGGRNERDGYMSEGRYWEARADQARRRPLIDHFPLLSSFLLLPRRLLHDAAAAYDELMSYRRRGLADDEMFLSMSLRGEEEKRFFCMRARRAVERCRYMQDDTMLSCWMTSQRKMENIEDGIQEEDI